MQKIGITLTNMIHCFSIFPVRFCDSPSLKPPILFLKGGGDLVVICTVCRGFSLSLSLSLTPPLTQPDALRRGRRWLRTLHTHRTETSESVTGKGKVVGASKHDDTGGRTSRLETDSIGSNSRKGQNLGVGRFGRGGIAVYFCVPTLPSGPCLMR